MGTKELSAHDVQNAMEEGDYQYINLLFADMGGRLRCMEEHASQVGSLLTHGVGVDGSSVPGYAHSVERSDVIIDPSKDLDTFSVLNISGETRAHMLCRVLGSDFKPHPGCPRTILANVVDKARRMGFEPYMMSELEFYVVDGQGNPVDNAAYLDMEPEDVAVPFRHELVDSMTRAGLKVKRVHHECGPGQNEVELQLTPALKNADDTLMGMWLTRLVAKKYGWSATFSPKPITQVPGNGLHQHILLRDRNGKNIFAGGMGDKLSLLAHQFVAGMIKYARDITAVFARSLESFERLKPGFESPAFATWDFLNRSALVRIPLISPGAEDKTRVEYRGGDAAGSPHLMCAAILAAGLKGIEDKLVCPPNMGGGVEHLTHKELEERGIQPLPRSVRACVAVLQESQFLEEALGSHGIDFLIRTSPEWGFDMRGKQTPVPLGVRGRTLSITEYPPPAPSS